MRNRKKIFDQPVRVDEKYWYRIDRSDQDIRIIPTTGITIPFSTLSNNSSTIRAITTSNTGESLNIILSTFSSNSSSPVTLSNHTFSQTATLYNSFIMPVNTTLQSIYISSVSYSGEYNLGTSVITPYVAIATAPSGSNIFTVNPTSITPVASYTGIVAQGATNFGSKVEMHIDIPAGTRVAIVCGLTSNGSAQSRIFNFNGSLYLN